MPAGLQRCRKPRWSRCLSSWCNALLVGAEIAIVSTPDAFWKSFLLFSAQVGGDELAVMYLIGLPLLLLLRKNELGDRIAKL